MLRSESSNEFFYFYGVTDLCLVDAIVSYMITADPVIHEMVLSGPCLPSCISETNFKAITLLLFLSILQRFPTCTGCPKSYCAVRIHRNLVHLP